MARKTVRREKTGARDTIDGDPQQIEKETKGKNKFDTTARRPSNTAPVEHSRFGGEASSRKLRSKQRPS